MGLAYDLLAGENNRLTLLSDFNQPNNNTPGSRSAASGTSNRLGGSDFGFALRGSYSYTGANNLDPLELETALNDEEKLHGLAFGGGLSTAPATLRPRLRLCLQVHGHSRRHQLLQLQARLVKSIAQRCNEAGERSVGG